MTPDLNPATDQHARDLLEDQQIREDDQTEDLRSNHDQ
ncbi:hypothetical protein C7458_105159 [Williamsia muralis]|nr:hypothetical protein C7458_105159 [Williamsia marianensis]